jgi:hypothetical protein
MRISRNLREHVILSGSTTASIASRRAQSKDPCTEKWGCRCVKKFYHYSRRLFPDD